MPYEDDLPNIFANLASLVVSGNGTPQALATIYSTGNLPQEEPSGPTLADLEEQFQREQGDTYTDILSSTGNPHQAGIIASAQSREAINAAVNQTMVNILAKDENKVSLAADAVMSYEGPLDPDMNVADIVAPIYNVSPTKVEAVLKDRGKLAESYAKPFYDMDIGQDIIVQPEIIKPGPMAGDPWFNQAIDMKQEIDPTTGQTFVPPPPPAGEPSGGLVITPAADIPPWQRSPYHDPPRTISSSGMAAAGHPGFGQVPEVVGRALGSVVEPVVSSPFVEQTLRPVVEAATGVITDQGLREADHVKMNVDLGSHLYSSLTEKYPELTPQEKEEAQHHQAYAYRLRREASEADPVGVISDDPEAEELRAINNAIVDEWLADLQREFQNALGDPRRDNAYFLGRINEIMDTTEGRGSGFAGRSAEDLLASWGENLRSMKPDPEAAAGTTPTVTDPAQEEVMLGPFRSLRELATIVEGAEAAPILTKMLSSQDRTYDYFVSPEGLGLWVDQEKNLWGAQEGPGGIDQLISYGQMAKGGTWNNETEYTLGGHTWLHNPDNAAMPWRIKDEQPVTTMAGGAALPLRSTLRSMTPTKQWETLRAQEMGENIWNPVQWGTRMQGFQPAYGQWLISGQQHTTPFHEFVQSGAQPDMAQTWQELARASAELTSPRNITNPDPLALGRQVAYQGLLQADAARTNAVLMASAAMGAGEGYGADAMRAQLGSMYDVFAAEAAAAGQPVGGFIDWLNQRIVDMPGSVAPAGAGGQGSWGT